MRFLVAMPLLWACVGESVLEKQENIAPMALIVSHSDGVEVLDGYIENFRATITDEDHDSLELQAVWYVGDDVVCDWAEVSPAGESLCQIVFTEEDTNVIIEVRDAVGAGGRHEIGVLVQPTEIPIVEMLTPLGTENYYSDQLIQFSALVSDLEDASEDLIVVWTSNVDGELILDTSVNSNGEVSDYTYLTEGNHAIEVRVEDSSGKISTDEVVIQVGGENSIPSCSIVAPEYEDTVVVGDAVTFQGTAVDPDIPATELSFSWISDKDGELGAGAINSSGEILFSYSGLTADNHIITLAIEDEIGAVCQDTTLLIVGNPPTATIDSPTDGDIFSVGETIIFRGTVSDSQDQPNEISIAWNSDIEGELQTGSANSQGISQFTRSDLQPGVHSIAFSGTDSSGLVADDLISFRVNTLPVVDSLSFSSDPVYSNQNLSVTTSSFDADGHNVTNTYAWYEDGLLTAFTGTTINASELDVGETWTVRVTPDDGFGQGNYVEETITIANSEPTISSVNISPNNTVYNDDVLSCSATASDVDQSVTPSYTWDVNGNTYIGSTLNLSNVSVLPAAVIICTASVTDNQGASVSASSSVTIDNRAPTVATPLISPASAYSDTTLSCSAAIADSDGESPSENFDWQIAGASIGAGASITLDHSFVSIGDSVTCVVTATDGSGEIAEASSAVIVQNTDPSVDSVSLTPAEPSMNDSVLCEATGSDTVDGDTPSLSFSFFNQTTGASYSPTSISANSAGLDLSTITISSSDVLVCGVTAMDSNGATATDSASISIVNSAPIFDQVATIDPSTDPYTGDQLTCSALATDPDGGAVNYSYSWQVNGQSAGTNQTFTVSASVTDVGQSITCMVVAVDQDSEMTSSTSSAVNIMNSLPEIINSSLSPSTPDTMTTVSVSAGTYDADGETVTISYEWHVIDALTGVDSVAYSGSGNSYASLSGIYSSRDDEVYVLLTPQDPHGVGIQEESDHVFIANTAPTAPTVSLTSSASPAMAGVDDLTCTLTNTPTDLDTDTMTYTYNWYDPTSQLVQINTSTAGFDVFSGASTTAGVWTCELVVSDGSLSSSGSDIIDVQTAWDGVLNFTTCGQTGRTGPSQSQCDSTYSGTTLDGLVMVTSGFQYWTVPTTGTYSIVAVGAGANHVLGASIEGEISLTAGEQLKIVIGQQGDSGGGGHGGSFVALSDDTPLIVAGGGGGLTNCTSYSQYQYAQTGNNGGNGNLGSGGNSGNGGNATNYHTYGGGGGGGFYTDGTQNSNYSGRGIAFVNGAQGGDYSNYADRLGGFGGGGSGISSDEPAGGGGYSGGGGGGASNHGSLHGSCRFGGGGGSYNIGANPVNSSGINSADGYVLIDLL